MTKWRYFRNPSRDEGWAWNLAEQQGYWADDPSTIPKASNQSGCTLSDFLGDPDYWTEVPAPRHWDNIDPDLRMDEGL